MAIRLPNGNTLGNYGTGGAIREITPDKQTVFHVKFDVPTGSDYVNKMVGHNVLIDDLYALNGGGPQPSASAAARLAAVAQAGGDAVDRQVDGAPQLLGVALARAQPAQQFDLQVVQRIDVRDAVAQAARQRRVAFQQRRRAR